MDPRDDPPAASPRRNGALVLVAIVAVLGIGALALPLDRLVSRPEPAPDPSATASDGASSGRPAAPPVPASGTPAPAAPAPTPCRRPQLIADFEDDDPTVCTADGRGGPLVLYFDLTGTISPEPGTVVATHRLDPARDGSRGALRIVGEGHQLYGAGVAAHLASGMPIDVSGYEGVQGWFRSPRPLTIDVKLATDDTMSAAYGGSCEPTPELECNDHHGVRRTVGPNWTLVRAPIAEMKQLESGVRAPFDPKAVKELHVRVPKPDDEETLDFELFIDDLAFF